MFDLDDLRAVADGRFFRVLQGDPTRYTLHEDGLTLALGFAVVDHLRRDHGNGRDLDESLAEVIEPVAAVDDTVSVVLAALTITCNQSSDPPDFAVALIRGFADLQNPDESEFPPFAGLARNHPTPFTEAARRALSLRRTPAEFRLDSRGSDPRHREGERMEHDIRRCPGVALLLHAGDGG